jgi:hypothetical protein
VPPPAVGSIGLHPVAEGTINLGDRAPQDDGDAPPAFYRARNEAEWGRVFDAGLRRRAGPNGPTIADALKSLRETTAGYDFSSSALILLLSPATDNYEWDVTLALESLPDGSVRMAVSHRHDRRQYVKAPDVRTKWALYRTDAPIPEKITMRASHVRVYLPSNGD